MINFTLRGDSPSMSIADAPREEGVHFFPRHDEGS